MASAERMALEDIGKDLEGNGHGLFSSTIPGVITERLRKHV
jgi:hypothetical protein